MYNYIYNIYCILHNEAVVLYFYSEFTWCFLPSFSVSPKFYDAVNFLWCSVIKCYLCFSCELVFFSHATVLEVIAFVVDGERPWMLLDGSYAGHFFPKYSVSGDGMCCRRRATVDGTRRLVRASSIRDLILLSVCRSFHSINLKWEALSRTSITLRAFNTAAGLTDTSAFTVNFKNITT